MSSNWPTVKTGEIFDLINGFAFKSKEFCEHGAPVLKIKNVKAGYLSLDNLAYVDPIYLSKKSDKVAQKNDLLITMSGNRHDGSMETWVGKVSWFNENKLYLSNQRVGILRVKEGLDINPRYMAYQLSSVEFQKHFIAVATSSGGQANLSPDQIKQTELSCPPRNIQDEIVNQIGSLEDKAKINSDTNQTLEQIAQAIFKSWFVDFDPVKAKIEALAAGGSDDDAELAAMSVISAKTVDELNSLKGSNPEAFNKLAQTAALFPAAMQDSELGEIPEGWDNGKIGDVVQFSSKRADVSGLNLKNYISTENMLENKRGITTASSLPIVNSVPAFDENEILISNIRPYFKKIWLAEFKGGRSPDVLGFSLLDPEETEFAYNLLYQDRFFEYMMTTSKGAKMPRGDKSAIKQFSFPLPQKELRLVFSKHVRLFYPMIRNTNRESEHLHALRDALLPELLSGNLGRA